MKKAIIAGAVCALVSAGGFTATLSEPPDDIVKKQRITLQHYGAQSKVDGSKARAEAYSDRIRKMIKSLGASKARFDAQKGSSTPSNPYAKYNGVWEFYQQPSTAYCDNGSSTQITGVTTRARFTHAANGTVTTIELEEISTPGQQRVSTSGEYHRMTSGNTFTGGGTIRWHSDVDGYYSIQSTANGTYSSKIHATATTKGSLYYERYGITCTFTLKRSGDKVAN